MQPQHLHEDVAGGVPMKMWTRGVPVEDEAKRQLAQRRAPAHRLHARRGDAGRALRHRRDRRLGDPDPQGHHPGGGRRRHRLRHDRGAHHADRRRPAGQAGAAARGDRARRAARPLRPWRSATTAPGTKLPRPREHGVDRSWSRDFTRAVRDKHPSWPTTQPHRSTSARSARGNHFIEVCLDEARRVWVMLHSGSRGVGNRIGTYFIELAQAGRDAPAWSNLPDRDLAYFAGGHAATSTTTCGRSAGRRTSPRATAS